MSDTVPAYGVFVLMPQSEPGRLDEATKECADVAELHAAIDQALEHGQWQAMCIVRGEDIPLMLQGAYPTPPT